MREPRMWEKVKHGGLFFTLGFAAGAVMAWLYRSRVPVDDPRAAERVTREQLDRSVAELRDIVSDIGTGVHVSQQRLERAERATHTIERGLGYIGDGIDGVREATGRLRDILERAESGNRCPCCGDIKPRG